VHHRGDINTHINGLESSIIDNWIRDEKHGLLHGFCTGIISGLLLRGEFLEINKCISDPSVTSYKSVRFNEDISFGGLNATCFLHDLLKANGNYHEQEQEVHDRELVRYAPNLIPQAYTHINPLEYNHPFLIADVVELRRYEDYKNWYNQGKVEHLIDEDDLQLIDCFYSNIRPSLERSFSHRSEAWARHGPESPQNLSVNKYPQGDYEPFAFEIDRLPFNYCYNHGICVRTGFVNSWAILRGIIPLSIFEQKAEIVFNHPRKHEVLHGKFNTGFNDWVFVVNYEKDNPKYQTEWVLDLMDELIGMGCRVVNQSTLNSFVHLINSLTDRMKFLSVKSA